MNQNNQKTMLFPYLEEFSFEHNLLHAIEKKRVDMGSTTLKVAYFLDYYGYLIPISKRPYTPEMMSTIRNSAELVRKNASTSYNFIYYHPSNTFKGFWMETKKYIVDDDNMVKDIKKAILEAQKDCVRLSQEGKLRHDNLTTIKYVMMMTYEQYQFNPWAPGEVQRITDLYMSAIDRRESYKVTTYL
jgi:hypothetical protein